ncbi:hypothetical protein BGZ61DRAFT_226608 [Ilyonectria robusta]|uniref:uncharacterized protein n=1 Tax=Ilyonectria robusta TaxID=1079257 RepID=UPI001E8CEBB1|nr:uncharacterized protein BGZ61DRAFT_226608 [Ilyonectria robusta]KAH8706745.1 hypothetical protein BGZ61DRAFT_226608 [Ilyonectria robusta]
MRRERQLRCSQFSQVVGICIVQYLAVPANTRLPCEYPGSHPSTVATALATFFSLITLTTTNNRPTSTNKARLRNMPRQLATHPTRHATTDMRWVVSAARRPSPPPLSRRRPRNDASGKERRSQHQVGGGSGAWRRPALCIPPLNDSQLSDHLSQSPSSPTSSPELRPPRHLPALFGPQPSR